MDGKRTEWIIVFPMAHASDHRAADPVLARLFRFKTSLKAGGFCEGYEILATYETRSGDKPFAVCRDGLVIDPASGPRFVPFAEIEDAGYYNDQNIDRAKKARASGAGTSEPLSIRLRSGEVIDLPVEVREDGMPDLLTIAKFIHQRATICQSEKRKAAES